MKSVKKWLPVLLALVLILALSIPAMAAKGEYVTTRQFLKVMDREDEDYELVGVDDDDDEDVVAYFEGETLGDAVVHIFFNPDLDEVDMRCWDIITFADKDYNDVLEAVNDLNNEYKFVKFTLDTSDNTVSAEMDAFLRQGEESGEIAYDVLTAIEYLSNVAYEELQEYDK